VSEQFREAALGGALAAGRPAPRQAAVAVAAAAAVAVAAAAIVAVAAAIVESRRVP
jgi:hypothetical protein